MKTNKFFQLLTMVICTIAFAFVTGCEGPTGPMGPAGADGKDGVDGKDGSDGTAGVDGNAICLECHNLGTKNGITLAYDTSTHATSGQIWPGSPLVYEYAGGRVGCGMCHSDQGFIETQYTGLDTLARAILLPQRIQCRTCHSFHESLDFENDPNFALRINDAVDLLMYRAAGADPVVIDFKDNSNLCANCHQPRTLAPVADDKNEARITSPFYGPHHGPQSTSLAGIGAYELGTGWPDPGTGSTHATNSTCTTCHMYNQEHSWAPSLDACNTAECHGNIGLITSVTDNTRQVNFRTSLNTLKDKLTTAGLLDQSGSPVVGTFGVDSVGAVYNYEWLVDDRSSGIHNFLYTEKMLNNTLALFQ